MTRRRLPKCHSLGLKRLGVKILESHFQQYLSYIVVVSFNWRGKLEYPQKATDMSQVTDKLYHIMLYRVHLRLISIDCTGSCHSNYHMTTSTTAPPKNKETQKLNSVILFKGNINIQ